MNRTRGQRGGRLSLPHQDAVILVVKMRRIDNRMWHSRPRLCRAILIAEDGGATESTGSPQSGAPIATGRALEFVDVTR